MKPEWIAICLLAAFSISLCLVVILLSNRMNKTEDHMFGLHTKHLSFQRDASKKQEGFDAKLGSLTTEFKRFSSPDAIATDMEQTANLIEMRAAGRRSMPVGGTEPHAKVHRPEKRYPGGRGGGWDGK